MGFSILLAAIAWGIFAWSLVTKRIWMRNAAVKPQHDPVIYWMLVGTVAIIATGLTVFSMIDGQYLHGMHNY